MILRRRFLHQLPNQIPKTPTSSSSSSHSHFSRRYRFIPSPRMVDSTLSNCPSDIISLSFFLWCSRQPDFKHKPQSFDRMVSVVGRLTHKFETVKGVVREMESFGCFSKPKTFLILLEIYWRGGMYELALDAFQEMINYGYTPNTFARNVITDILFKVGHGDTALRILTDTQNPNFITFNIALRNLCKLNKFSTVCEVWEVMLRKGFSHNSGTFSMILNCFCKAGLLVESLQVLSYIIVSGIPLSVEIWSILIDGFCRVGKVDVASQFLEKMVQSGCSPNTVTYTSLFKGFMEAGMFDRAIDILNGMESQGCIPDLVLYNVQINLLSKLGRYDDALKVFLTLSERNLEPDSYTRCSILSTLCMSHQYELPSQLVSGLAVPVDLVGYNCLLMYLSKAERPSLVVDLYIDMLNRGFVPDGYSYTGLLRGLCRAGRLDDAINVYYGIIRNNYCMDPHIHTIILCELIKVGRFHKAVRLFREAVFENFPLDVVSYTVAIHALLKGGRTEEAHSLYCQMTEVGLVPNAHTCNVMLHGLCKAGEVKLMAWLLKDMLNIGIITSSMVIGFLLKFCQISSVIQLYIEMQELGLKPSNAQYALLVDHLARAKRVENASKLLYKDVSEDVLFVESTKSDVVSSVG